METEQNLVSIDALTALCKRRGFVYPASEIYGGINGFWDYGPLGAQLKNNIRDWWWKCMVECPPLGPDGTPVSIVGLDSSIIQNPKTWVASGHVGGFNDPMVDCTESKKRYREDQLDVLVVDGKGMWAFPENQPGGIAKKLKKAGVSVDDGEIRKLTSFDFSDYATIVGPDVKTPGTLTEPRQFNLMFETHVGAVHHEDAKAYLRPETAQGIFLNYKNVVDTTRVKMPFGVAQIGKSFRNEVTPRNFIFRSREFEQMEMEWFCPPEDSLKWYTFWKAERMKWWKSLGVSDENLIFRDHDEDELAHYSNACVDVEYRYPFTAPGYGELEGIAHRGCYDLTQHQEHSGQKLEYFDQERNERYIPHVIEPASGLTRAVLVVLCEAYCEEFVPKGDSTESPRDAAPGEETPEGFEKRTVMRFIPRLAPIKVAVFPLLKNKPELVAEAREIFNGLRTQFSCTWDQVGAIGRRYRRQDEIGTPFCVTIDFDSLEDGTVTLRDRDTMTQTRIHKDELSVWLHNALNA